MMDTLWVCKDGREVMVSDMDTRHIINCIRKIMRSRRGWRREYLERLRIELTIRELGLTSKGES